ncbi:OLC1v1000901C1 [Oldenlandia corymbosa var. corymbosa]|uniref:OLC1v1000901C1 n=1 Tax=Oldenlandia corymbosa var. corymbosa TaxID=529605 RepID=A0AAV1D5M4_OLDCO|nr:OLC1v1000901C1 [Oldenlandia corymbosa var. corymbosa]
MARLVVDPVSQLIAGGHLHGVPDSGGAPQAVLLSKLIESICKCHELRDQNDMCYDLFEGYTGLQSYDCWGSLSSNAGDSFHENGGQLIAPQPIKVADLMDLLEKPEEEMNIMHDFIAKNIPQAMNIVVNPTIGPADHAFAVFEELSELVVKIGPEQALALKLINILWKNGCLYLGLVTGLVAYLKDSVN